jgi:CheY-like chemotaxis protein
MNENRILPACPPCETGGTEALTHAGSAIPRCEPARTPLLCQSNPPHRILVVEDDISILQLNTELLQRSGYAVDTAEDGAAAWDAINAGSYDLLITDNVMPKVTGVELLEKLRAAHVALPVIMATGIAPTDAFTRDPWIQPDAILLKPYTGAEMLRTVKKVLREAGFTADAPRQDPGSVPPRALAVEADPDFRRAHSDALVGPDDHVAAADSRSSVWLTRLQPGHLPREPSLLPRP